MFYKTYYYWFELKYWLMMLTDGEIKVLKDIISVIVGLKTPFCALYPGIRSFEV